MRFENEESLAAFFWNNPGLTELELAEYTQESLPRLPACIKHLTLRNCNRLRQLSLPAGLQSLSLTNMRAIYDLRLPTRLRRLSLIDCPASYYIEAFPNHLKSLHIEGWYGNLITNVPLPESLKELSIANCSSIIVKMPPALARLKIRGGFGLTYIGNHHNAPYLPDTLTELELNDCGIRTIEFMPKRLQRLILRKCRQLSRLPTRTKCLRDVEVYDCPLLNTEI